MRIVSLLLTVIACAIMTPCPAFSEDAIVTTEMLIEQLSKNDTAPSRKRGFIVKSSSQTNSQQTKSQPSATIYVYFLSGSVKIADAHSKRQLEALGTALTAKALRGVQIEIGGHTDNVGSEDSNLALSRRRAQSISSFLEKKYNVRNIATKGYGESAPVASNDTPEGRSRNRRVVITRLD